MVRMDRDFEGGKAILLDGFVPGEEYFRGLNWDEIRLLRRANPEGIIRRTDYRGRIAYHLDKEEGTWSDDIIIRVYRTLVEAVRESFCPYEVTYMRRQGPRRALAVRDRTRMCDSDTVGTGRTYHSFETGQATDILAALLPALQADYRADKQRNRGIRVHTLVLAPQIDSFDEIPRDAQTQYRLLEQGQIPVTCEHYEECIQRWLDLTGFHTKPENEYLDLPSFKQSWDRIIDACISQYQQQLSFGFLTRPGAYQEKV